MSSDKFLDRLPKYRLIAALLILFTIAVCSIEQISFQHWGSDPRVFLHAARLMLQGGDIVNTPNTFGLYYVYPPFFAFLYIPLLILPTKAVIVLWTIVSVILLGWSMAAFYSGMTGRPFLSIPARTRWVVFSFVLVLTARFIFFHLQSGQSDIIVLALSVFGLVLLSRKQELPAGLAFGLSIVLKITSVPFVFWFLAKRSGKVLAGMVLGCLVAVTLPALIVGPQKDLYYHREWFKQVFTSNSVALGVPSGVGNLSMRAQLGRFFQRTTPFTYRGRGYQFTIVELQPRAIIIVSLLITGAVAAAIVWYAVHYGNASPLISEWGGYALVFGLIPTFSTWTEIHHLVLLVPAYLYVVHLWYSQLVTDPWFKVLVVLSFIFLTLTTKSLCGTFLSQVLTSLGFINYGLLLLSTAIFRAATRLTAD